ncbi:MAG: hypothetical protein M3Y87_27170, partial [Myxococcota bacterium]|nr:hypothetical protein [Myxococcota bacterium]
MRNGRTSSRLGLALVAIALSLPAVSLGCGTDAAPSTPDGGTAPDATVTTEPDGGGTPDAGPIVEDVCAPPTEASAVITPDRGAWREGFVLPGVEHAHDLATGPDLSLYVGGAFEHVSGHAARNIARLTPDGRWEALGAGLPSSVSAITVSPAGIVYAATGPAPARWSAMGPAEQDSTITRVHRFTDGAWELYGTVDGGAVFGLAADADERLYAIGDFFEIDGVAAAHFAVRVAGAWQQARALA